MPGRRHVPVLLDREPEQPLSLPNSRTLGSALAILVLAGLERGPC